MLKKLLFYVGLFLLLVSTCLYAVPPIDAGLKMQALAPLTVEFEANCLDGEAPTEPVDFFSDAGKICHWDFGDGADAYGNPVTHVYDSGGVYDVRVNFYLIGARLDGNYQTLSLPPVDKDKTCHHPVEYQSKRYARIDLALSWTAARDFARQVGGNLATVGHYLGDELLYNDREKFNWVYRRLVEYYDTYCLDTPKTTPSVLWVDGSDAKQEGEFLWEDGTVFYSPYWDVGQPDNHNGNEDYLAYWKTPYRLNDLPEDGAGEVDGFIIEFPNVGEKTCYATFDPDSSKAYIPCLKEKHTEIVYQLQLQQQAQTPTLFELDINSVKRRKNTP